MATYDVRPGDTLREIARRHGTTVKALSEANGLRNPDQIRPGQQLRMPGDRLEISQTARSRTTEISGWDFSIWKQQGAYDASEDRTAAYDIAKMRSAIPGIWGRRVDDDFEPWFNEAHGHLKESARPQETYAELFTRIGEEMGVDPHAMAAYCMFESFDGGPRNSLTPQMKHKEGGLYAAGIAATQAQDWAGKIIPGTDRRFPDDVEATALMLRANPEYGLRCLASLMKPTYEAEGDLAKALPKVAFPAWDDPQKPMGAYGTQAQYASRAYALYRAFHVEDGR